MKRAIGSLLAVGVFLAMAGTSYGQGGTTSTLAGVVVDGSGGVNPRRQRRCPAQCHGRKRLRGDEHRRRLFVSRAQHRTVHRHGIAAGVQDRDHQQRGADLRRRRERSRDAGGRRARRNGHGLVAVGDRPDAELDDLDDDQHQSDHEAAAHQPERDGLRAPSCPASRPPTATGSRPSTACRAATINITLDGVNIQDNTLRVDRRVLRHREPAAGRHRGGDGPDRVAGGRRAGRARCR